MTSLWKVGIRPQSKRNIQIEYWLFQFRNVTLKWYVNKNGSLVSVESKVLSWAATIIDTRPFYVKISWLHSVAEGEV